jgi:hypothetical protein
MDAKPARLNAAGQRWIYRGPGSVAGVLLWIEISLGVRMEAPQPLSAIINSDDYFLVPNSKSRAGAYGALTPSGVIVMIKPFFSLSTPGGAGDVGDGTRRAGVVGWREEFAWVATATAGRLSGSAQGSGAQRLCLCARAAPTAVGSDRSQDLASPAGSARRRCDPDLESPRDRPCQKIRRRGSRDSSVVDTLTSHAELPALYINFRFVGVPDYGVTRQTIYHLLGA